MINPEVFQRLMTIFLIVQALFNYTLFLKMLKLDSLLKELNEYYD